jgi:Peptidase C39 family.
MKKVICLIIVLASLLSFASAATADIPMTTSPSIDASSLNRGTWISVQAAQGGMQSADEGTRQYWDNLAPRDIVEEESRNTTRAISATWTQVTTTYYSQQQTYSCGAACGRMMLKQLTGVTYPEATIINETGTTSSGATVDAIIDYINTQQSSHYYYCNFSVTKNGLKTNVYNAIATYGVIALVGIQETVAAGWPFALNSHGVVAHSVLSDKSAFGLCDPWAGYVSQMSYYNYDVSDTMLYNAYISSVGHGF